ncbi:MAG: DUF4388 domain-containing protein [Deltaproteobacteria bacterium]|jgi:hypothetical protein|nr:DUF4388 domain-containing protein [Deltaproteobacteria bacterium]
MTKQTKDISYEMITWDAGVFSFKATEDLPAIAQEADLKLEVDNILMECFRKVDEWRLIEKEIDDFDLILLRNDDAVMKMGRHKLMKEEITILELVNGRNSVRDIIRKSRLGSFDVSKILYRLLSAKLIRKKISAVAL